MNTYLRYLTIQQALDYSARREHQVNYDYLIATTTKKLFNNNGENKAPGHKQQSGRRRN